MLPRARDIANLLNEARRLVSKARDAAAKDIYLGALRLDPTNAEALGELAGLAVRSGHRSAARTAYEQAVRYHPQNTAIRVNLGNLLFEDGDLAMARQHFAAAVAADPDLPEAHQGLARALTALGEPEAAKPHWEKGFIGHALALQRYRGSGAAIPVLVLVSVQDGNIPVQRLLDDTVFAVTAVFAEFFDPAEPLPPHALVFNAIGDADLCAPALAAAKAILARTEAPLLNHPDAVSLTGRAANARRLGHINDVVTPAIRALRRLDLLAARDFRFPLLVRAPGFHTGQHFVLVERHDDLAARLASLPGDELLAMDYLDARGADGMARKYRVMIIDGVLYPLHLAISADWKVHYFTADMALNAAHRAEEAVFLDDMEAVLRPRATSALKSVARALDLDYAGVDFGLTEDGRILLFEANAAMVIYPPDPDPIWDYRREPVNRALAAVKAMLLARSSRQ